ncbi:MAG: 1-deoxy-D-xylulose-5-phosphate synthase [Coriobacteriia bacterium]|nr:1-deoxy-D-xylulose-5-phosphate synthase [Coriobacteriia bacterium]
MSRIIDAINGPGDLKVLTDEELEIVAKEIRDQIVRTTSHNGGHVGSSLGAVEIILALHAELNCPTDKIVYDVGHQAYAHKILTGRLDDFDTLRQAGGISGFPKPSESPYDVHPSGHASDSLSVALGLAKARDLRGTRERVVAVIGDAAISGGMAFEALNQIGQDQTQMVIILNDNEMSISRNVGALMNHFGELRALNEYRDRRDLVQRQMENAGPAGRFVLGWGRNAKDSVKHFFLPERTMIFEQLGITCTAPIDGHDIGQLRRVLRMVLHTHGPTLVHVVTKKGAGYEPAMNKPETFHGIGPYDAGTGTPVSKKSKAPKYMDVFGQALVREARLDGDIVAITAAMKSGTGLSDFAAEFPHRFMDTGITEEHAVGLASGLAIGGKKPVVAIYSTFLQRAIDQMAIDVALPNFNVTFCIDRAGLVGDDGPTHNGLYDLVYTRMIPHMKVFVPSDEAELVNGLHTALQLEGPVAIRYPRGEGRGVAIPEMPEELPVGKARVVREGDDVALLAFGTMVAQAEGAADLLAQAGIQARVVDMRWAKPLDEDAICEAAKTRLVVTLEEGVVTGGVGEGILCVLAQKGLQVPALVLGLPDRYVQQGKVCDLYREVGLDSESIANAVQARLA